ncbi:hypothetical protein EYF80_019384 [Liparis tanakae]|uniref:Uncharacterized protein n=1 Tax=Liparis tanakae TaxID=230148 RepID=A0A4Z2HXG5_9TELE|nr:hypothetical protein EYF80_019384 [Liparis tanakae]
MKERRNNCNLFSQQEEEEMGEGGGPSSQGSRVTLYSSTPHGELRSLDDCVCDAAQQPGSSLTPLRCHEAFQ